MASQISTDFQFVKPFAPALLKTTGQAVIFAPQLLLKSGVKIDKQAETQRSWEMMTIDFSCKGRAKGQIGTISITGRADIKRNNPIVIAAIAMGCPIPEEYFTTGQSVVDEDGLEVDAEDYSELFTELLKKFFAGLETAKFTANVTQNDKGYWQIDANTLQPFVVQK